MTPGCRCCRGLDVGGCIKHAHVMTCLPRAVCKIKVGAARHQDGLAAALDLIQRHLIQQSSAHIVGFGKYSFPHQLRALPDQVARANIMPSPSRSPSRGRDRSATRSPPPRSAYSRSPSPRPRRRRYDSRSISRSPTPPARRNGRYAARSRSRSLSWGRGRGRSDSRDLDDEPNASCTKVRLGRVTPVCYRKANMPGTDRRGASDKNR